MMTERPTIHIVDDDSSFRRAVGAMLEAFEYNVELYASAAELLEKPLDNRPACILLDLQMSGLDGLQLQKELLERHTTLPIVFISGHGDIPASVQAIKAGAEDFLTKPVRQEQLLAAIERALERHREARERGAQHALLRARISRLTPREYEIFLMIVRGQLSKQIAYAVGATERTIKFHRRNIMQKCEAKSIPELVLIADRMGLR